MNLPEERKTTNTINNIAENESKIEEIKLDYSKKNNLENSENKIESESNIN